MSTPERIAQIRSALTEDCSRLKNGNCRTTHCMVRAGYTSPGCGVEDGTCEHFEAIAYIDHSTTQLAAAREDTERLNWLELNFNAIRREFNFGDPLFYSSEYPQYKNPRMPFRELIDQLMRVDQERSK